MIKHAEKTGSLKKDKSIIIEPSSGNIGIALAGISSALSYKVEIFYTRKGKRRNKKYPARLGATVHETSDDLCPRVGAGTDRVLLLQGLFQSQGLTFIICQISKITMLIF